MGSGGGVKDKLYKLILEKRLYCWVLFFQFMETFKTVFLPFAIIVFIKKHPELHYLFAASLGNNDWNSYCITSLNKKFKASYFMRSRTNKAWLSEHVFCSPCAGSHCNNIISPLSQSTFPVSTAIPITHALLYSQLCSALAPAASPLLFTWSFSIRSYHVTGLCCSCGQVKKQ